MGGLAPPCPVDAPHAATATRPPLASPDAPSARPGASVGPASPVPSSSPSSAARLSPPDTSAPALHRRPPRRRARHVPCSPEHHAHVRTRCPAPRPPRRPLGCRAVARARARRGRRPATRRARSPRRRRARRPCRCPARATHRPAPFPPSSPPVVTRAAKAFRRRRLYPVGSAYSAPGARRKSATARAFTPALHRPRLGLALALFPTTPTGVRGPRSPRGRPRT